MRKELTQVALGVESVEGTKETLDETNVLTAFNAQFEPDIQMFKKQEHAGTMSKSASVPGARMAKISFDIYARGGSAAGVAPSFSAAMRCAGWDETIVAVTSVTYTPVAQDTSQPSATVEVLVDGKIQRIWGARGTCKIMKKVGESVILHFEFFGADWEVVDGALYTGVTYDSIEPPSFLSVGFTIGAYAAIFSAMEFDLKNKVALRKSANASSGHLSAKITNRDYPSLTLDPEDVLEATGSFFTDWKAGTTAAMSCSIGSGAGKVLTFSAPAVQYQKLRPANRDDEQILNIDALCVKSSGDDEFSLAIT